MMNKYPESVPLPGSVQQSRLERRQQMIRMAKHGVLFRGIIILAELAGYALFNSSALILDAISTCFDIASSIFLIFCIRLADKPPDRNHPFGHGRLEPFAGLQLGVFLVIISIALIVQQTFASTHALVNTRISAFSWLIPFIAVILLEIAYHRLKRTAKKQNSPALLADAMHYRIDAINSVFATIALILAAFIPRYSALFDHIGALLIAILMGIIGAFAMRNNIHQLLDYVPSEKFFSLVKEAALRVEGVLATEKILIQTYGPDAHVDIDIEVAPDLSVEVAHQLAQAVRAEIQKAWPSVRDVIVHTEPYYPGDH
jgi:cation diffusion facilitator family transporter